MTIPLNGPGVTNKVTRALTRSTTREATTAEALRYALSGATEEITGTGFGLTTDEPAPRVQAVDPSQGRGNPRPRAHTDPFMQAFQRMGLA